MGMNAIQTIIPWNFHEEVKGVADFETGERNLVSFIRKVQQQNMLVLLRLGPYVCGEVCPCQ